MQTTETTSDKPRAARLRTAPAEVAYDADDIAALDLLRPGAIRSAAGLPAAASGRSVWEEDPESESFGLLGGLSPICEAALSIWGVATIKPAVKHIQRRAHYWSYVVLGLDLAADGNYHLLRQYVPLAVAAGISVEAIEHVRRGELDRLEDPDREDVEFIRRAARGTLTDEQWRVHTERIGEAATAKQVHLILFLWAYVRVSEALLRGESLSEAELDAMLERLRQGDEKPADLDAYEAYYASAPWPRPV